MSIQRCSPRRPVSGEDFEEPALVLKAIAEQYRLKILAMLTESDDEVCVCEFTEALPLNQPTVSHHLRILREADLVTCERRGTWVYYRLAPGARERVNGAVASAFRAKAFA